MKMTIKATGIKAVTKQLEKDARAAQKVLTATGNDMRRRVPGKVADEVVTVYGIKKSEITPISKSAKKPKKTAGSIRVKGATVSEVSITYAGRLLTPTHFSMTPKAPPKPTGKKRKRKPITAQIKKGKRKSLGSDVFLGLNKKQNDGEEKKGIYIAWRRKTNNRYPIESVKTLSLPQMIDNQAVNKRIQQDVNELLEKRLEHNLKRFLK